MGDLSLIPGLERSPGERNSYLLQYSGLENSMDYTVPRVAKSWTWLSEFHFYFSLIRCVFCKCFLLIYGWEGLGARGEGDDRGWDGWMASLTQWTWVSVNSGSWWWTGRPGVLWFMGRKESDMTERLIWYEYMACLLNPLDIVFSRAKFLKFNAI